MSGKSSATYPEADHAEHISLADQEQRGVGQPAHAEHGVPIDHQITQEDAIQARPDLLWSRIRHQFREPSAEFFGVFILILFGNGSVAQVVLSKGEKGGYQSISWGWG
jgi:aquaglyceroporin related protein, other eukaryote